MRINRYAFVFVAPYVLLMSLTAVKAQTAVDYRFLEVLDADRKPVAGARVETNENNSSGQTDENGAIRVFPLYGGDINTRDVKVSKSGYFTYEEKDFFAFYWGFGPKSNLYGILLKGGSAKYGRSVPIKIELLKMPATSAERKTFEVKRQEQELLKAVKHGDAATVRSLLRAGVSANATDVYGIPAILLAVTVGYVEAINALLTAGADVNAKLQGGVTALSLAKQNGDEKIIKLIESAASKPR